MCKTLDLLLEAQPSLPGSLGRFSGNLGEVLKNKISYYVKRNSCLILKYLIISWRDIIMLLVAGKM